MVFTIAVPSKMSRFSLFLATSICMLSAACGFTAQLERQFPSNVLRSSSSVSILRQQRGEFNTTRTTRLSYKDKPYGDEVGEMVSSTMRVSISSNEDETTADHFNPQKGSLSLVGGSGNKSNQTLKQGGGKQTVLSSLPRLFQMGRPSNILGVVVFHVLGAHLAVSGAAGSSLSLLSVLAQPSMWNTLLIVLGISSTSMVVNDYYDTRLSGINNNNSDDAILELPVHETVVKSFLMVSYVSLLIASVWLPGLTGRMLATSSLILTFCYTKYLKPVTWIKNIVCASIMSLSPLMSGSVALESIRLLQQGGGASMSVGIWQSAPKLARLVAVLFFGFVGREMIMDMNDVSEDASNLILTVPVRYGTKFASRVALGCTGIMGVLAVMGHVNTITRNIVGIQPTVSLMFALAGSVRMVRRAFQVYQTNGANEHVNVVAVEEGKNTMLLLLASFV